MKSGRNKIKYLALKYKSKVQEVCFKIARIEYTRWNEIELIYGQRYIDLCQRLDNLERGVELLVEGVASLHSMFDKMEAMEPVIDKMVNEIGKNK